MENFEDDNPKNLYVIRRKLAEFRCLPGTNSFAYLVGHFRIVITSNSVHIARSLVDQKTVNISLYEMKSKEHKDYEVVFLTTDSRFKDHLPIQYNVFSGPCGQVNLSDGKDMPILHLCELIKYLHRLSNLTVFM